MSGADLPRAETDSEQRFWCRRCGMVVTADEAPWCRHNDLEFHVPASRMTALPAWHPMAMGA